MKKIIIALAAFLAAFTMASCNKELVIEPEENTTIGKSLITASIEGELTKTSLSGNDTDGYKVLWSKSDSLFVGDAFFYAGLRSIRLTTHLQAALRALSYGMRVICSNR